MQDQVIAGKHSRGRAVSLVQLLYVLVAGLFTTGIVHAEVPSTVSYQGRLTTSAGVPVADGTYSIAFRIYDDSIGGSQVWEEVKSVTTKGGLFSVQLGEINPLNQSTFSISNLFLSIQIGAGPESLPRTRLNVVPYASRVGTLDSATGGFVTSPLRVNGIGYYSALAASGGQYGGGFDALEQSSNSAGVMGSYAGGGDFDGVGVKGLSTPADGWGVGGDFEGGWIGCRFRVTPTGSSSGSRYGLTSESYSSGPFLTNYGADCSAGGGFGNYGVRSHASTAGAVSGATAYGIYTDVDGSGGGLVWAGYFNGWTTCNGTLEVLGTLYKPGGAFRIDHPLDPENKYLEHSFVESPDMKNIYDGIVVLNGNGEATVQMADWFEALNKDFRYQLTAIGAPAPGLYISREVENNQFSIAGGKPGLKVSWTVTGIRHDPYANANRIQVEVPKPSEQRGLYVAPEAYGLGLDKHIHHRLFEQVEKADVEMAKRRVQGARRK